jgi:hypothetical protein
LPSNSVYFRTKTVLSAHIFCIHYLPF